MARRKSREHDIVDALGNRVGTLAKVTKNYYIDIGGIRWQRGYSSGMHYEIRKKLK